MNVLNTIGIIIGVGGPLVALFYVLALRERYRANMELYSSGNTELRAQNSDLRSENTEKDKEIATLRTRDEEKGKQLALLERLNSKQSDFAGLAELISNNHTELLKHTDENHKAIIKAIVGGRRNDSR